MNEVVSKSI